MTDHDSRRKQPEAESYSHHFRSFVDHFNRGEYRACVEPLEAIWFIERDDFHKGLIRLVVALHQMRLGLDSGPRFLLATARALLRPYHPRHNGLDLVALDAFIARQQARLDGADDALPFFIRLEHAGDDS